LIAPERLGGRDNTLPVIAGGSLILFLVALAIGYALPILRGGVTREASTADEPREVARGRAIYDDEGCWYCHTQAVRPVAIDAGIGPVQTESKTVKGRPPMGINRIGPDLACAGDRLQDAGALAQRLKDPRATVSSSVMPGYSYLSDDELAALAAYITSLKCT
jgi:cbb3-type cytochrome oxidase cytochrome c subunit